MSDDYWATPKGAVVPTQDVVDRTIQVGDVLPAPLLKFDVNGVGERLALGHATALIENRDRELTRLRQENAALTAKLEGKGRLGVLYHERRRLEEERDRYVDANCRLGAENEKLRDQIESLTRERSIAGNLVARGDEIQAALTARVVRQALEISMLTKLQTEMIQAAMPIPLYVDDEGQRRVFNDPKIVATEGAKPAESQGPYADYHGPKSETDPAYPAHKAVHEAAEHLLGGRVTNPQARGVLRDALDKAEKIKPAPSGGANHAAPANKAFRLGQPDGIMGMARP